MLGLPDGVEFVRPTLEQIDELWDRVRDHEALFPQDYMRSRNQWIAVLMDPGTILLSFDGGVGIFTHAIHGLSTDIHLIVWDHKLSPRTILFQDILVWAFLSFGFERIQCELPSYSKALMRYIDKKLGFRYEGTKRCSVRHNGKVIDSMIYSLTKEDVNGTR